MYRAKSVNPWGRLHKTLMLGGAATTVASEHFGRPGPGLKGVVNFLGLGTLQPTYPMPPAAGPTVASTPFGSTFWDQWVKYFVTRDASFDSLRLDPENPGKWRDLISELTALQDINKADLSAFEARGGTILMAHGVAHQLVSTRATEDYYQRVRAVMGADRTARVLRYYEVPGYNRCLLHDFQYSVGLAHRHRGLGRERQSSDQSGGLRHDRSRRPEQALVRGPDAATLRGKRRCERRRKFCVHHSVISPDRDLHRWKQWDVRQIVLACSRTSASSTQQPSAKSSSSCARRRRIP